MKLINGTLLIFLIDSLISIYEVKSQSPYITKVNNYTSNLSFSQEQEIKEMIDLKNDLLKDQLAFFSSLPRLFQPEKDNYYSDIMSFNMVFIYSGVGVILLIVTFLILRFWLKKFKAISSKRIDKTYKIVTWLQIGLSLLGISIIYLLIFLKEFNFYNNFINNYYSNSISNLQLEKSNLIQIDNFKSFLENKSILTKERFLSIFNNINLLANKDISETNDNLDSFKSIFTSSIIYKLGLFAVILITSILIIVSYIKKVLRFTKLICLINMITLPLIIFLQMKNFQMFFIMTDLCQSNQQAIYQSKLPIYGKGLGWINNCYNSTTKIEFYALNQHLRTLYEDDTIENEIKENILSFKNNVLDKFLTCESMYNNLVQTEDALCYYSPTRLYVLIIYYFILFIPCLILTWGSLRLYEVVKKNIEDNETFILSKEKLN